MNFDLHILLPLLLVPAKFAGVIARKCGAPAVIGEIFTGLLLGPAVIGLLPAESGALEGYETFYQFAQIGLCLLLFRIGLETDIKKFTAIWRPAVNVAIVGMLLPFALGVAVAYGLGWNIFMAAFAGATLTATSIGVTVSVLDEFSALNRLEGRIMLGAAVLDDIFGLLILSGMVAMAIPGEIVTLQIGKSLTLSLLFLGSSIWLGPYLVKAFIRLTAWAENFSVLLVLTFAYLILLAWIAHSIGLAMIIGAYAAGLSYGGHAEQEKLHEDLRPLIGLLTPLFFILIGASISFDGFNPFDESGLQAWMAFGALFLVAVIGKFFSGYLLKEEGINKLAIGSGMMPRGEVGFVFAQVGLSNALLNQEQYTILALVLLATTVAGPLLLRLTWKG